MKTTLGNIKQWLEDRGEPKFRYKQVEEAWFTASNWDEVTTLSKDLREDIKKEFEWLSFSTVKVFSSKNDATKKALITLADGNKIETVLMPNAREQYTVCVSSQIGCAMTCTFCATGTMGLKRNLTADEIIDQIRYWRMQDVDRRITNVVFMGMGEPLANYEAVTEAVRTFIKNMDIGPTRITVSTVGVPVIMKRILTDEDFPDCRMAFSLHAGTDETRQSIVPSHKQLSMDKIYQWVEDYINKFGTRSHYLTFQYVMLAGQNDMPSEARALVKRFAPLKHRVKFNLIPWNPVSGKMAASSEQALQDFHNILEAGGLTTTIRYSKGLDIHAACGQLVIKKETA